MALAATELIELIKKHIPDAEIELDSLVDDGDHYQAHVRSKTFEGLSRIAQHQRVYEALEGRMGNQLHALSLKTSVL